MGKYETSRNAPDSCLADPEQAVASIQGIAAAWMLVLVVSLVAVLPCALNVAEVSAGRTARVAQSEFTALPHSTTINLRARRQEPLFIAILEHD